MSRTWLHMMTRTQPNTVRYMSCFRLSFSLSLQMIWWRWQWISWASSSSVLTQINSVLYLSFQDVFAQELLGSGIRSNKHKRISSYIRRSEERWISRDPCDIRVRISSHKTSFSFIRSFSRTLDQPGALWRQNVVPETQEPKLLTPIDHKSRFGPLVEMFVAWI